MIEPGPEFKPPHCPSADCEFHRSPRGWRFKRDGTHLRRFDGRRVQRYRCSRCGRSFSSQTFSTTYWLKRPDLLDPIARGLVSCAGYRQIARALGVAPSTVELQAARIGRHMLLFAECHRPHELSPEPLAVDGFESFEFSQYWITHLNVLVGTRSHFIHATTVAELRRKGRMTSQQKRRREELERRYGRPDSRALERSVAELLALAVPSGCSAIVRSDGHAAYPRALASLRGRCIRHEVTSSRAARTSRNPLFPINLLDLLMRHSGANLKRETIAFSKRNQSMLWREALFRVWRNWIKHVSERRRDGTPAMRLGLADRRLEWSDVLARRFFVTRMVLPRPLDSYYWGRIPTRQIPRARTHSLAYAY